MRTVSRWLLGVVLAGAVLPAGAQPTDLKLTRQQRAALQALVTAANGSANTLQVDDADWPVHLLRASDGSHYVAFSLHRIPESASGRPLVVYVRLATVGSRSDLSTAERSGVAEWLAGQTPAPVLPRRGIAFGQMPTYGASGISRRDPVADTQNLQLLNLERERAREKREAQERARKAALEGEDVIRTPRPLLPFEDFDLNATLVADRTGQAVLRRSLTAGPGSYELTVAWLSADAKPAAPRVARRLLTLPAASTTSLALSSVIVADDVHVRDTPVPATDQTAYPYSIGPTEITPARDHILTTDERLALVMQVINARGTPAGKPDIEVSFRMFRRNGTREENVGMLAPQQYNELTLPLDFDVAKGHPIFAAVAVPLNAFKRGEYRLAITANDRVAGSGATTDLSFTIAAQPADLLKEAAPLAEPFNPKRENLPAEVPVMMGALRASEGNDREAIAVWRRAIDAGADPLALWPVMVEASIRVGDVTQAVEIASNALRSSPSHPRLTRQLAKAHLLAGRHEAALTVLDGYLKASSDDVEARWLVLHTLYASFVAGTGPGSTPEGRQRLIVSATQYADANGPHAALARDWARSVR